MALTDAQKIKIIRILGYPYGTLDSSSLDYSKIISDKINITDENVQAEVEQLLEYIDKTDTRLESNLSLAGVTRMDDIEFSENGARGILKSEKNRYIKDLSLLLGIACVSGSNMGVVIV